MKIIIRSLTSLRQSCFRFHANGAKSSNSCLKQNHGQGSEEPKDLVPNSPRYSPLQVTASPSPDTSSVRSYAAGERNGSRKSEKQSELISLIPTQNHYASLLQSVSLEINDVEAGNIHSKILIPMSISRKERSLIKEAYESGIESVDSNTIVYISKYLPRVITRLQSSEQAYMSEIASVSKALLIHLQSDSQVSNQGKVDICAALYYLCDPLEIIPDYIPGRGYADDAFVLNMCISRLRKRKDLLESNT